MCVTSFWLVNRVCTRNLDTANRRLGLTAGMSRLLDQFLTGALELQTYPVLVIPICQPDRSRAYQDLIAVAHAPSQVDQIALAGGRLRKRKTV